MAGRWGTPPSWQVDPVGRHELRYWNGESWTDHVSDGGVVSTDPLASLAPPDPVTAAAHATVPGSADDPAVSLPPPRTDARVEAPSEPLGGDHVFGGPRVFISYRRSDTRDVVIPLAERLRHDLDGRNVFRDEDDLIAGQRWQDAIEEQLRGSDATVFVVGPAWVGPTPDGRRRIDDHDDPVRREVALAVRSDTIPVPVLVDLAEPPPDLPSDARPLFEHHAVRSSVAELLDDRSRSYQHVLVGIWESLRQRTPNGVLVLGDAAAMASLDRLVDRLRRGNQVAARDLSRFACGAYLMSARRIRRGAKRWPDVIIVAEEERPDWMLLARMAAADAHPAIRTVAVVGAGAVAAVAAAQLTGGASATGTVTSTGTAVTTATQASAVVPAAGPLSAVGGAVANLSVASKVAVGIGATALAGGAAIVVPDLVDDDPQDATFGDTVLLSPGGPANGFPLGEPDALTVTLGPPSRVSDDEARDYFANFEGGVAERRSVEIELDGARVRLDDLVVPVSYPNGFVERNEGVRRLSGTDSGGDLRFVEPGTGAASPCVFEGTGDTVGGWEYTGGAGFVSLDLLVESDGAAVTDVGMRVTFEGPADVVFFDDVVEAVIPPDVDVTDRCTPIDRLATAWVGGVGQGEVD